MNKIEEKIDNLSDLIEQKIDPKKYPTMGLHSNLFKKLFKVFESEVKKLGFKVTSETHDEFGVGLFKVIRTLEKK